MHYILKREIKSHWNQSRQMHRSYEIIDIDWSAAISIYFPLLKFTKLKSGKKCIWILIFMNFSIDFRMFFFVQMVLHVVTEISYVVWLDFNTKHMNKKRHFIVFNKPLIALLYNKNTPATNPPHDDDGGGDDGMNSNLYLSIYYHHFNKIDCVLWVLMLFFAPCN